MGNNLKRLADIVNHVRDSLEWRVVTVKEVLDAEDSIVHALSGVEQVWHKVPWVAVDLVGVKSSEDSKLSALQFHAS